MAASNQAAMKIILPVMVIPSLLLLWPLLLISKLLSWAKRSMFREKMAGKVVLITGAASGIGEHLAYEYARKGARLALVDIREEDRSREVADKAMVLGSPDVIVIRADVSKTEDCKRFIDETMNHFGQLNHLVNNAGVHEMGLFEDYTQISDVTRLMDINFWGSVQSTQFALPHLRKSKGRIVVISSAAGWFPVPKTSFYNATKGALTAFYETLSVELGSEIGITIVTPGFIQTEMAGNYIKEANMEGIPPVSAEDCAKSIVKSACRGDRYLTEPSWLKMFYLLQNICPELMNWINHRPIAAEISKKSS